MSEDPRVVVDDALAHEQRQPNNRCVAVVSGGMDSVVMAHVLQRRGHELAAVLSVDYGQRHARELHYARLCAEDLGAPHVVVDLSGLGEVLGGSALTDEAVEVPEGHYAAPTMRDTVVPNRNMILLSVAIGHAVAIGARTVATAVHAGDHPVYPDCRPEFIRYLGYTARVATEGHRVGGFDVMAPFVDLSKAEIALLGREAGVDFARTWSCYKGGRVHCGRCSTCVERIEALHLAGVEDPTRYEDPAYWRQVVA